MGINLKNIPNLQVREALERLNSNRKGAEASNLDEKELAKLDANGDQSFTADDLKLMGLGDNLLQPIQDLLTQNPELTRAAFANNTRRFQNSDAAVSQIGNMLGFDPRRTTVGFILGEYLMPAQAWTWSGDPQNVIFLLDDATDRTHGYHTDLMRSEEKYGIELATQLDPELGQWMEKIINQVYKMKLTSPAFDSKGNKSQSPAQKMENEKTIALVKQFNDDYLLPLGFALIFPIINNSRVDDEIPSPLALSVENADTHPWPGKEGQILTCYHVRVLGKNAEGLAAFNLSDGAVNLPKEKVPEWLGLNGPKIFLENIESNLKKIEDILKKDSSDLSPREKLVKAQFTWPPYFDGSHYDTSQIKQALLENVRIHEFQHVVDRDKGIDHTESNARLRGLQSSPIPLYGLYYDLGGFTRYEDPLWGKAEFKVRESLDSYAQEIQRTFEKLNLFLGGTNDQTFDKKVNFVIEETLRRFEVAQTSHVANPNEIFKSLEVE